MNKPQLSTRYSLDKEDKADVFSGVITMVIFTSALFVFLGIVEGWVPAAGIIAATFGIVAAIFLTLWGSHHFACWVIEREDRK